MKVPIVVDLDGTLIKSDSSFALWKKIFKKQKLTGIYMLYLYFFKGEAEVKKYSSKFLDQIHYQINENTLNFLKEKQSEHKIILATGADIQVARHFAKQFPIFDLVIGSEKGVNCIGVNKLLAIQKQVGKDFIYIGDHWYDFPIWQQSAEIVVINPSKKMLDTLKSFNKPITIL